MTPKAVLSRRHRRINGLPSSESDTHGKDMERSLEPYFKKLELENPIETPNSFKAFSGDRTKTRRTVPVKPITRSGDERRKIYAPKAAKTIASQRRKQADTRRQPSQRSSNRAKQASRPVRGTPDHHPAQSKQEHITDLYNRLQKARLGECSANACFWRAKEKLKDCEKTVSQLQGVIRSLLEAVNDTTDNNLVRCLLDSIAQAVGNELLEGGSSEEKQ